MTSLETISFIKKTLSFLGIQPARCRKKVGLWSLKRAIRENGFEALISQLEAIEPDISDQFSFSDVDINDQFSNINVRAMHAFQCSLVLDVLESMSTESITIVDIGDSSGRHMRYLKELTRGSFSLDTISVNLDPVAVEKIRNKGQRAELCRAEDLDLGETKIDLFVSFEMVEHLHNPAIFFRRLAKKSTCNKMVVTVPYLKTSRVGFHNIRSKNSKPVFAEEEHVFELNPEDWTLLFNHSGWKVVKSKIFFQYPTSLFWEKYFLRPFWRSSDYEGFWGVVLEKDLSFSDLYQDWEE